MATYARHLRHQTRLARQQDRRAAALAYVAIGATLAAGLCMGMALPLHTETEYVAVTWSGDEYVLGVGDDCAAAMENAAPVPADWREISCRTIYANNL